MMKIYEKSLNEMKKIVARYTEQTIDFEIEKTVSEIIQNVAQNGDQAVRDYERKFDNVNLADFSIPAFQLDQALDSIDEDLRAALELAKQNITSFHKQEIENSFVDVSTPGIMRGEKITPLASVGLYVPGGTAAYPSTILMCGIPAKLAGVKRVVMVTPPQPAGINPAVLAAARLAGVDEVYQVGGAQAIAALAYGTETIPAVDKIMGPGNIFVATAKKQVFGKVAIDMVAGPSEIGILADESANAKEIAADLLSQAEHDKRARAMLITNSKSLAEAVSKEVDRQLNTLPRQAIARTSIEDRGFIAVMENTAEMFELMNDVAPEHLEVQLKNPTQYLGLIKNAGSVFLGRYASEPLGDYVAGPNHVLPTGGTARFASPLGVYDFVKRTQFIQFDRQNLKADLKAITKLARTEGLEAHARAVEARFDKED
jgi:histidinol dehydrogenase